MQVRRPPSTGALQMINWGVPVQVRLYYHFMLLLGLRIGRCVIRSVRSNKMWLKLWGSYRRRMGHAVG